MNRFQSLIKQPDGEIFIVILKCKVDVTVSGGIAQW